MFKAAHDLKYKKYFLLLYANKFDALKLIVLN
jgi:hypothetical protein